MLALKTTYKTCNTCFNISSVNNICQMIYFTVIKHQFLPMRQRNMHNSQHLNAT